MVGRAEKSATGEKAIRLSGHTMLADSQWSLGAHT
jgi:hypothetical protein